MRKPWLVVGLVVGATAFALALLAFARVQDTAAPSVQEASAGVQPIAFPHDVHAGTYQMQCMYCHFSADRSVDAGIPPIETCMGCHRLIQGSENPEEIQRLTRYYNDREPIPWHRIYKVSDHVTFPHMRHVNAGLACQVCHGPVQEMGVLESRAPEWRGDDMGWCVSCHVRMDAARDCTVCHY